MDSIAALKEVPAKVWRFLKGLFAGMALYEVVIYVVCLAIYGVVISRGLDARLNPTNRLGVLLLGLVLVSGLIGFTKSFSARVWNGFFFVVNLVAWGIGVAVNSSLPWREAIWITLTQ